MAFNLNNYSEAEKYDLFRRVVQAANKKYGEYSYGEAEQYRFQKEPGSVNLLGVRGLVDGKVTEPKERAWDDRIFIIFLDDEGNGRVKEYEAGTEHGSSSDDATSLLLPGQHPYRLGYHRSAGHHKRLQWFEENAERNKGRINSYKYKNKDEKKRIKYRALEPYYEGEKGLRTVLDKNKNLQRDGEEQINWDAAINIHHGGPWVIPVSRGCQVIRDWDNYLDFIETLEKDYTIKGTESNELAEPRVGGSRPVIYTLVTGEFLRSVAQNDRQPASDAPPSNGASSDGSASQSPASYGRIVERRGFFFLSLPFGDPPEGLSSQRPRATGTSPFLEKSPKESTQGKGTD